MNNLENLQHKTKEIILFFLVVILLSSLLILLFPAGLAVAGANSKLGPSTFYSNAVLNEI